MHVAPASRITSVAAGSSPPHWLRSCSNVHNMGSCVL